MVSLLRVFRILSESRSSETRSWFRCFANFGPWRICEAAKPRKVRFGCFANSLLRYPTKKNINATFGICLADRQRILKSKELFPLNFFLTDVASLLFQLLGSYNDITKWALKGNIYASLTSCVRFPGLSQQKGVSPGEVSPLSLGLISSSRKQFSTRCTLVDVSQVCCSWFDLQCWRSQSEFKLKSGELQ